MNTLSSLWTANSKDFIRGLIVAILGGTLSLIIEMLQKGGSVDWKNVGITAAICALSYIVKCLGTDETGKVLGKI